MSLSENHSSSDVSFEILSMPTPQGCGQSATQASRPSTDTSSPKIVPNTASPATARRHSPFPGLVLLGSTRCGGADDPAFPNMNRRQWAVALAVLALGGVLCLVGAILLMDFRIDHAVAGRVESMRRDLSNEIRTMHTQYQMRLQRQAAAAANDALRDGTAFSKGGMFSTLVLEPGIAPTDGTVQGNLDVATFDPEAGEAPSTVLKPGQRDRQLPPSKPSSTAAPWTSNVWDVLGASNVGGRVRSGLGLAGRTRAVFLTGPVSYLLKSGVLSLVVLFASALASALACLLKAAAGDDASAALVKPYFVAILAAAAIIWIARGRGGDDAAVGKRESCDTNGRQDPVGRRGTHPRFIDAVEGDGADDVTWTYDGQQFHGNMVPHRISVAPPSSTFRINRNSACLKKATKSSDKRDRLHAARRAAMQAYAEGRLGP